MKTRGGGADLWLWSAETMAALAVAGGVFWFWPRLGPPMLGAEHWWFGLAWLVLLAGPALLGPLGLKPQGRPATDVINPTLCAWAAYVCGALFLALLLAGQGLGNQKLWLGVVYFCGVTVRLLGLSLGVRDRLRRGSSQPWLTGLAGALIALLACLLCLPWVRPDLAAHWPPPLEPLGLAALSALLWAAFCGGSLVLLPWLPRGRRVAWIIFLALGLGVLPALAVSWFEPGPLAGWAAGALALAGATRLAVRRRGPSLPPPDNPLPVYWLLRALMFIWWAAGLAVTLAVAWWRPDVGALFMEADWLRALALGAFLATCLALLAEYSMPLMGQEGWIDLTRRSKALSLTLTAVAVAAALGPLVLLQWPRPQETPAGPLTRLELLPQTVTLWPENPEITLVAPNWLGGISRLHVVGHLTDSAAAAQGAPVVQVVITDEQDVPYIYLLRAGVDLADVNLDKRSEATEAGHQKARVAGSWTVYTPTGEAFQAHDYYTGLFLGSRVGALREVRLRYIYKNKPGQRPLRVVLLRVALE